MIKIPKYPHAQSIEDVSAHLNCDIHGLSSDEALQRKNKFGANTFTEEEKTSLLSLLIKQFKSWLVIILIIAAVISFYSGQLVDAWVIIAIVILNASLGFSQEYRAEKAIEALRRMIVKTVKVHRDGVLKVVDSTDLVPGDLIILEEGDSIAADARIIHSKNFRAIEASLTGESLPIYKKDKLLDRDSPLADRSNMVWKGTFAAVGYAKALVTGTAENTAIGEISKTLSSIESTRSNFMKKTDTLGKQMALIAIASASLIFIVGYFFREFSMEEIILTSIAALVAAIPEGLPAIIAIVLAIGANRMAKRNAIIREFTATETLGAVTAILTDKTGTLTQNKLSVVKVKILGESDYNVTGQGLNTRGEFLIDGSVIKATESKRLNTLLRIAAISNNSQLSMNQDRNQIELIGDPTEGAMLVLAKKAGLEVDLLQNQRIDDLPFNSEIKLRGSITKKDQDQELLVTGAPEKLIERSEYILAENGEISFKSDLKEEIEKTMIAWSNDAMRVIGLAYKKVDYNQIDEDDIDGLCFVGLVGMVDQARPNAKDAVEKCRSAGIRVIMVTGDHRNTAIAIARQTGIINQKSSDSEIALTEQELLELNDHDFAEAIDNISVFARLSPKMKLRIAGELQSKGHLIAMTGDGVNDAPALKQADVGISMGIMGTDVARNASDMVLADDDFSSIVSAVEEGRIVFKNSRQTSFFLITTNFAESLTLLAAIAIGLPLPLTATQILWLNLVTDGAANIALATEPGHSDIMKADPMPKDENILNKRVIPYLLINLILMVGFSLSSFYVYQDRSIEYIRTIIFIIMSLTQLFNVFNLRAMNRSVFEIGIFSNKYINIGLAVSVLLLILVTQIPLFASIFHFEPVSATDFLLLIGLSSSVLWSGELYKFLKKQF